MPHLKLSRSFGLLCCPRFDRNHNCNKSTTNYDQFLIENTYRNKLKYQAMSSNREIRAAWSKWSGWLSSSRFCPFAHSQKLVMVLPAWALIESPSYNCQMNEWMCIMLTSFLCSLVLCMTYSCKKGGVAISARAPATSRQRRDWDAVSCILVDYSHARLRFALALAFLASIK